MKNKNTKMKFKNAAAPKEKKLNKKTKEERFCLKKKKTQNFKLIC